MGVLLVVAAVGVLLAACCWLWRLARSLSADLDHACTLEDD